MGSQPSGRIVTAARSAGNGGIRDCTLPPHGGRTTGVPTSGAAARGLAVTPLSDQEVPKLARA